MLFNDLNGVLIGANRAGLARAPVARAPLVARARAWPYYLLLDAALGQRPHGHRGGRGGAGGAADGLRGRQERGHGVAEGARALVQRGRRRHARQRRRDVALWSRGCSCSGEMRRQWPCWGWGT